MSEFVTLHEYQIYHVVLVDDFIHKLQTNDRNYFI